MSPTCDNIKTFNATLRVDNLLTQNCIKKKDTILINSQKKINKKTSPELKKK